MTVINFFAGPGAGKSTLAAEVFAALKVRGLNAELVTEYAKDMVYENRGNILQDQLYILAKQHRRLARLNVDFVVTDSPLLLGLCYTRPDYFNSFAPLVREIFNHYDNLNFLLTRPSGARYFTDGRNETEEQARECDSRIARLLAPYGYTYLEGHASDNVQKVLFHAGVFPCFS